MREVKPKVTHEDEPTVEYAPGYQVLSFPYFDWTIKMKVTDEWNLALYPDVYLRIYEGDEDVTHKFMLMDESPGFIRPTLYNLTQMCYILSENMEVQDADSESEEDASSADTSGLA